MGLPYTTLASGLVAVAMNLNLCSLKTVDLASKTTRRLIDEQNISYETQSISTRPAAINRKHAMTIGAPSIAVAPTTLYS